MGTFEAVPPEELYSLLIKRTSATTGRSEKLVHKIINFQFQQARRVFREVGEVEISGFGRFVESPFKIQRKFKKFIEITEAMLRAIEEGRVPEGKEETHKKTICSMLRELFYLRYKLRRHEDRLQRDFGGSLEFSFCEGKYRESSAGENSPLPWLFKEFGASETISRLQILPT